MNTTNLNVPLLLPEYGRNVQHMVEFLLTLDNREQRQEQAEIVISTMSNVYPHNGVKRDTVEFRTMLYDHLFMISGFQLDIDWEFEKPDPAQFAPIPAKIPYDQQGIVRKQYGCLIPRIARRLASVEDPEAQTQMAESLAIFMRQKSYDYNGEYPSNELIIADLYDMSNGAVSLTTAVFDGTEICTTNRQNQGGQNGGGQRRSKNRRNGNQNRKKQQ